MKQKQRYWLFKRRHTFYIQDSVTGEQKSLCTSNRDEAERIRLAKSEAAQCPHLGLVLAKAYLAAYDPRLLDRTWAMVMEEHCSKGKISTQTRGLRAIKHRAFDIVRNRKLIETTADDLRAVIKAGGTFTGHLLRWLRSCPRNTQGQALCCRFRSFPRMYRMRCNRPVLRRP